MKIIRYRVGATAVAVPSKAVIVVDPDAGRDTAVGAIRAILPDAQPEAVRAWMEEATPTDPLMPVVRPTAQPNVRPGRHRNQRPRSFKRTARQIVGAKVNALGLAAAGLAVFLGVGAVRNPESLPLGSEVLYAEQAGRTTPMPQPTQRKSTSAPRAPRATVTVRETVTMKPVAAESPWKERAFASVAKGGGWTCDTSESQVKECVSPVGRTVVTVVAWTGPSGRNFVFQYIDPAFKRKHRAELKVFKTDADMRTWIAYQSVRRPNLVVGKGWVFYGTDARRIAKYGAILKRMDK